MERRTMWRVLGAVVVLGVVVQVEWSLRTQAVEIALNEQKMANLEARMQALVEARAKAALLPPPPMPVEAPRANGGRQAKAGGGGGGDGAAATPKRSPTARARQRTQGNPHAQLLNRLYDVADQLADEEDWTDDEYDAVSDVIDDTSRRMEDLMRQVQSKQLGVAQARQQALAVRDEGAQRLGEILGPDAMERLKQAWVDEGGVR